MFPMVWVPETAKRTDRGAGMGGDRGEMGRQSDRLLRRRQMLRPGGGEDGLSSWVGRWIYRFATGLAQALLQAPL